MLAKEYPTLIKMLARQAQARPDQVAFTFEGKPTTFGEMWLGVNQFGSYLLDLGVQPGQTVVLAVPNSAEFFAAFYGVQRMGGIAVPLFPGSGPERIFSIAHLCDTEVVVAPSPTPQAVLEQVRSLATDHDLRVVTVSDSLTANPEADFPEIQPVDIAFLQYTSGSTGNPKGVMLSHDNLITNIVQMILGMEITVADIFVSWLPVYHDMGLILKTMVPFYLGGLTHLLSTNLTNIHPWLDAIQTHQATFTAAPDFAYRLSLRHINPANYDLTSLRVALNAAEPVRAQTMEEFEVKFGLDGVMVAGYGLAEATVGVSMWTPGSRPRIDARGFVSVGPTFPEVDVKIVSEGVECDHNEIGEIMICSAANSGGYYHNPTATAALFEPEGYFHSGDLGYLDPDGYLYIVSRQKNIIKLGGETISPREIEEIIDVHPEVRFCAAVGIDKGRIEGEQAYVFAEIRKTRSKTENDLFELSLELVQAIHDRMGFRPGRVYLLKRKSIPKTHNGKIQHLKLKEHYLSGALRETGKIVYPEY
jgi:acyl-CoA synthetase (AMP-forming)/AMP-acid ligase II